MLPAARISAAIEVLDRSLGGTGLESALTAWGRANRFAGSGDRAAIRDLVFDGWRCRRSFAALGGGNTGRGLMLGRARAAGEDTDALFTGIGHAPSQVTAQDAPHSASRNEMLDCPDWLAPDLKHSLKANFEPVMLAMRHRAPVFLRVNLARITRADAAALLAKDGVETASHALAASSLELLAPSRKIFTSEAYLDGLVEMQDAASQAVVETLPLIPGWRVLDFCAGGGGKSLALAARAPITLWAHDVDAARMRDLPTRAARAGAKLALLSDPALHAPYDLVLADAPCSGSGSWRRDPQGKWALTKERLGELKRIQAQILDQIVPLVAQGGLLAYATCSLLAQENDDQIAAFLERSPGWDLLLDHQFTPLDGGDGFFLAILTRK